MKPPIPSKKLVQAYLSAGIVAIIICRLLPEGVWQSAAYELIGVSAVVALVVGARVNRPQHARAWQYLAIGIGLFVAGDVVWSVYQYWLHVFPEGSIADVFYLAGYPFLAAGVLLMVRARTAGRDWQPLLDAAIFAAGMGLVVWELAVRMGHAPAGVSLFGQMASMTYPLADVLVIAVVLRLVFVPGTRVASFWLLLAGLALTLTGDEIFAIFQSGHVLDPLWLGGYVLIGAAALHPSMTDLTTTTEDTRPSLGLVKLLMLTIVLAVTMMVFDIDNVLGIPEAVLTVAFAGVVITRIGFIGWAADRMWRSERSARAALSDTEAMFRALVERIPAVTYTEEPDDSRPLGYRDTYVSPQVETILGIPIDEWLTHPENWRAKVHPDDRVRVFAATDTVSWDPYKLIYRVIPRPGEVLWVREEACAVLDGYGRQIAWQGIIYDISDEKAAEAETLRREAAEKANEAKSRFLSRASHELRTPLNAILGFGQLLGMDELKDSQRDSVEQIVKSGRHLLELVNDILDINNQTSPGHRAFLGSIDCDELLGTTRDIVAPAVRDAKATLVMDPSSRSGASVIGNDRLQQAVLNLLSNAIKYGGESPRITVGVSDLDADRIRISVADTGPGLSPEQLDRLWTPFDRLGAEERGIEGTGLGLALTRELIEEMNGTISVESTPGIGTTFHIDLAKSVPDMVTVLPATDKEVRA